MVMTQERRINFDIEQLSGAHSDIIPGSYIPIFSGHPWHEEFRNSCGYPATYAKGCSPHGGSRGICDQFDGSHLIYLTRSALEASCPNVDCNKSLKDCITPMFTEESVSADYQADVQKPGFDGFAAIVSNELVGFSWGYNYPLGHKDNAGSVWYNQAIDHLWSIGIDPEICFYHNESGTSPAYQGRGMGTALLKSMLDNTPPDRRFVVFRTINPSMVRCYEKVFEISLGDLKPIFKDPNPIKRQHWYALDLKRLNRKD